MRSTFTAPFMLRRPWTYAWVFTALAFASHLSAHAQSERTWPLHHAWSAWQEGYARRADTNAFARTHSAFRPLRREQFLVDTVAFWKADQLDTTGPFLRKGLIGRKLWRDHFLSYRDTGVFISLDPLFNLGLGQESGRDDRLYHNMRGFLVQGHAGPRLSFESSFYTAQMLLPAYYDSIARRIGAVPGMGRSRSAVGADGRSIIYAMGHLSWTPSRYFNLQAGHGQQFIGEGYRSMIWSDATFPNAFLRATTRLGNRIQYTNLYTQLHDLDRLRGAGDTRLPNKYVAAHYLSIKVGQRWEVGFFEAVIWPEQDTTGARNFELNYLNPVIFLRPVEFGIGSPDNMLIGANVSYRAGRRTVFYGQMMLDEFKTTELFADDGWWGNKFGYQLGVKTWEPFGLPGTMLRLEHNAARPFTYTHTRPRRSYSHYGLSLAHPLGANFRESLAVLRYRNKRWMVMAKGNWAQFGVDSSGLNYGHDVRTLSDDRARDYGNEIGQGRAIRHAFYEFSLGYLLNPLTNMHLELSYLQRRRSVEAIDQPTVDVIMLRWKTGLVNRYRDF